MSTTNLRDVLQGVYDQHGRLTPALVVDIARDPEHPLHNRFEWNDAAAGEAWRRQQAHELIRSVRVTYKPENKAQDSVRAFHAVRQEDGINYVPAEEVAQDPFMAQLVLNDMQREWLALKRRWEAFAEFWAMVRDDVEDAA